MMNFYVMTLFPEMIRQGMRTSILGRAAENGILSVEALDIRDYTENKHAIRQYWKKQVRQTGKPSVPYT